MITGVYEVIYFPTSYEKGEPHVLYVISEFEDEYKGSPLLEEVQGGRYGWFKKTRCQPYSDELFNIVMELVVRRKEISETMDRLRKKGLKRNKVAA